MRRLPPLSSFHPNHIRTKIPLFRIFYSGTFLVASLALAALLLISPGDHIYQSFQRRQIYHIIIVASVYVLTLLVSVFIYASRLFKTRSALASIPREIHLNDGMSIEGATWKSRQAMTREQKWGKEMVLGFRVSRKVHAVVKRGLNRSAIIAYQGSPRDISKDPPTHHAILEIWKKQHKHGTSTRVSEERSHARTEPIWGVIEHPGWSCPSSVDLPNLQYESVTAELPNLIEAKAVSLAPVDSLYNPGADVQNGNDAENQPPLDPFVVELLQRSISMNLRAYMSHLGALKVITQPDLRDDFLLLYEEARFSGSQLAEADFRALMGLFAELLRQMQPIPDEIIQDLRYAAENSSSDTTSVRQENRTHSHSQADTSSLQSTETVNHNPIPDSENEISGRCTSTDSANSSHSNSYTRQEALQLQSTNPSRSGASANRNSTAQAHRTISSHSLARSLSQSTTTSSQRTGYSASDAGSVIRLAEARGSLDLPYAFTNPDPDSRADFDRRRE